jgi:hypothetical protein
VPMLRWYVAGRIVGLLGISGSLVTEE